MTSLGDRLKKYRKLRQLSIYDVERETGIHFTSISKYERDERQPPLDRLRELAGVYGVPVGQLIEEDNKLVDQLPQELRELADLLVERAELRELVLELEDWPAARVRTLLALVRQLQAGD